MKFSLISSLLALVSAREMRELNPRRQPPSMKGKHQQRWTESGDGPVGTFVGDYQSIAEDDVKEKCVAAMKAFDSYCH